MRYLLSLLTAVSYFISSLIEAASCNENFITEVSPRQIIHKDCLTAKVSTPSTNNSIPILCSLDKNWVLALKKDPYPHVICYVRNEQLKRQYKDLTYKIFSEIKAMCNSTYNGTWTLDPFKINFFWGGLVRWVPLSFRSIDFQFGGPVECSFELKASELRERNSTSREQSNDSAEFLYEEYLELQKLAILNALIYLRPDFNDTQQKIDNELIINRIQELRSGKRSALNIDVTIQEKINSRMEVFLYYISRVFPKGALELFWESPEMIVFSSRLMQRKVDLKLELPFLLCTSANTDPLLPKGAKYAIAEFDFEHPQLNNPQTEVYVKNLALSLQSLIKNKKAVGGALILRGFIPETILIWLRGGMSSVDSSPVPDLEVLYAAPLPEENPVCYPKLLRPLEYWFVLKKGRSYRLKKANSKLESVIAKNLRAKWKKIGQYVVLDYLIFPREDFLNYSDYLKEFWSTINNTVSPIRDDIPANITEDAFNAAMMAEKSKLKKECPQKKQEKKTQAERMLDKLSKVTMDAIKEKRALQDTVSITPSSLYFLGWQQLISDTALDKDYKKISFQKLSEITPEILGQMNDHILYHKDDCYVRLCVTDAQKSFTVSRYPRTIPLGNYSYLDFEEARVAYAILNVLWLSAQLPDIIPNLDIFWKAITNRQDSQLHLKNFYLLYKDPDQPLKSGRGSKDPEKSSKKFQTGVAIQAFLKDLSQIYTSERVDILLAPLKEWVEKKDKGKLENSTTPSLVDTIEKTLLNESLSFSTLSSFLLKQDSFESYVPLCTTHPLQNLREETFNRFLYFYQVFSRKSNVVKFIYIIDCADEIKVARDKDRPTHSELANGKGVKAAGELIFEKKEDGQWHLIIINNGSGHYKPPAETLHLAKQIILSQLDASIESAKVELFNALIPTGLPLSSFAEETDDGDSETES